jgi:PAS domain-containing protein
VNEPLAQGLDQQRLFDLVIAQDALLAVVDEDDLLVFGNAALWEFTGRTPDDGLGKPLGDVVEESVVPDAPPTLAALLAAARTRNRPAYAATKLVDDGGDHHTFDLAAHPDTDVVLVVATDVTERERAIGVLSEDQNLLESVMDSAAEAIVVCDLDGRITSVNEAAKHHFNRFTEAAWDGKLLTGFDTTGRVIPQRTSPSVGPCEASRWTRPPSSSSPPTGWRSSTPRLAHYTTRSAPKWVRCPSGAMSPTCAASRTR